MTNKILEDFLKLCAVIDTESTGLDPNQAEVCEYGWTNFVDGKWKFKSNLYNTEEPIPFAASNKNNISREMLVEKPLFNDDLEAVQKTLDSKKFIIAHNYEYDKTILKKYGLFDNVGKWICTYRLAQHLIPKDHENFSYSQNYLRYHLGVDLPSEMPVHRAGEDSLVCAHILEKLTLMVLESELINPTTGEELGNYIADLSMEPIQYDTMPFGKHKDKKFKEIPLDYWRWALDNMDIFKEDNLNYNADFAASVAQHLSTRMK